MQISARFVNNCHYSVKQWHTLVWNNCMGKKYLHNIHNFTTDKCIKESNCADWLDLRLLQNTFNKRKVQNKSPTLIPFISTFIPDLSVHYNIGWGKAKPRILSNLYPVFYHLPRAGSKQLCGLADLKCTCTAGSS